MKSSENSGMIVYGFACRLIEISMVLLRVTSYGLSDRLHVRLIFSGIWLLIEKEIQVTVKIYGFNLFSDFKL